MLPGGLCQPASQSLHNGHWFGGRQKIKLVISLFHTSFGIDVWDPQWSEPRTMQLQLHYTTPSRTILNNLRSFLESAVANVLQFSTLLHFSQAASLWWPNTGMCPLPNFSNTPVSDLHPHNTDTAITIQARKGPRQRSSISIPKRKENILHKHNL